MINGFLMFSKDTITLKYCGHKILSVIRIVILWNIIISVPMMILKHKFINPLDQIYKCLLQGGYLWHFWFFGTLIILYLLLFPIHKLVSNERFGLGIHTAFCILLFALCIGNTMYSYYSHYPMCIAIPQSLRLWVSLFYYLTGGLISRIKNFNFISKSPTWLWFIFTVGLGTLCIYGQKHLGLYGYALRAAEYFYDELTVILWCIALFIFLLKVTIPAKICPVINGFSKISLGIFIIHPLILKASEIVFVAKTTPQAVVLWGTILVISAVSSYCISKIPYINKMVTF